MSILQEELDTNYGKIHIEKMEIPAFIKDNLNQKFELRDYQKKCFQYFITNDENPINNNNSHLLFNMATGSGKTLIMAGLILYFYQKGYRNFLFFVNALNIIEKTKENFINAASPKYLFNDKIIFDNKEVKIRKVDNFDRADEDSINICFTTIQGLHGELNNISENSLSFSDFESQNIVLLADEAHHINVETKQKLSTDEQEDKDNWEKTVKTIFESNHKNRLFEFTATMDLENQFIKAKYIDKIIFKYSLEQFCADKYSKDVHLLRADLEPLERALQAVILSQYRRKIAEKNGVFLKPVILMKSETNKETESNYEKFIEKIENLNESGILKFKKLNAAVLENESGASYNIMTKAFKYFDDNKISVKNLIKELQEDFSRKKCMLIHSKQDSEAKQILVNNLEDDSNEIRAIFNTDKLTEGWDVLNLFDIVRLYETRDSGHSAIGAKTISEAQLIGRGARYYPFAWGDFQKDMRKFDENLDDEMRILEELHYHSPNNHRYISELKEALKQTGIWSEKAEIIEMKLKPSFTKSDFYKNGVIFLNDRQKKFNKTNFTEEIISRSKSFEYSFRSQTIGYNAIFKDIQSRNTQNAKASLIKFADFSDSIFRTAFSMDNFYSFSNLQNYLDIETSDTLKEVLKKYEVKVFNNPDSLKQKDKLDIVLFVLNELKNIFINNSQLWTGLKAFKPFAVKDKISIKKTLKFIKERGNREIGTSISQSKPFSLSKEDWYGYEDCFGTSEEKSFVEYIYTVKESLFKNYKTVYLIRNERDFKLFDFENGAAFEPDFVLFLEKKDGAQKEIYQLFIEPKGSHLLLNDSWKEKFLLSIKTNADIKLVLQNKNFNLWGLPFYNTQPANLKEFKECFENIAAI